MTNFFTTESLLVFQGSTLAVLVVANVVGAIIGHRFYYLRKWVALVVALGLQALLVMAIEPGRSEWLIAAANALLAFVAALGINEATFALVSRLPGNPRAETFDQRIFASWLRASARWTWGPGR